MANFQLTQTGAHVQSDLNKVEGLAEIKTIGSGLTLSSSGELSSSGGGVSFGKIYIHYVTTSYGDQDSFEIVYMDGSGDYEWNHLSSDVIYTEITGPFRLRYVNPVAVKGVVIKFGQNANSPYLVPFINYSGKTSNIIQFNGDTASDIYGYISLNIFLPIGKDIHLYYVDTGRA